MTGGNIMKKQLSIGTLLLMTCTLVACQGEASSSSISFSKQESISENSSSSVSSTLENSNLSSTNEESSSSSNKQAPLSSTINEENSSLSSTEIISLSSSISEGISFLTSEASSSSEEHASSDSSISDSSSKLNNYYPIGTSSNINLFSNDVSFCLSAPIIAREEAENLIANDISLYPKEQSLNKKTCITSKRSESHVTENRSDATYSVKDLVEEKHTISQIDSDNKWYYAKSVENRTTTYFVEEPLYRHTIRENLYFVEDGCYYQVYAEKSYYEGMEDKGTYEAYYYKMDDLAEEDYIGRFTIHLESYTYFNETAGLNKIDKSIYNNFSHSSSFYYSRNYNTMERQPTYEFHSSGEKGDFGCVATDDYDYHFSDLDDYPSMEKNSLDTISYHQDYLVNISNYFSYEEDYLTTSVSKKSNGNIVRNETTQGRKKQTEGCEIFYPDLSHFEEREYNPVTK